MAFNRRLLPVLLAIGLALMLIPTASAGLKFAPIHLSGDALGSPIMTASSLIVMTQNGQLLSYDNIAGRPGTPYALSQTASVPPLVTDTVILTAADNGVIEAVDRDRLKRLWIYTPDSGAGSAVKGKGTTTTTKNSGAPGANDSNASLQVRSLASSGSGLLYVIGRTRVLAFEERTGLLRFNYELLQDGGASDADGQGVYAMDGSTLKFISSAGVLQWSLQTGALYKTRPVVDLKNGRVYVASTKGMVEAIDARSGEVNWTYSINGWPMATPLPDDGQVIIGTNDGRLRALDARNGSPVWTASLGSEIWGGMALIQQGAQRLVVVTTQAPSVAGVDADTGDIRWAYPLPDWGGSPAASADSSEIALTTRDRTLMVVEVSPLCSIDSPKDQQVIGPYPQISGRAWAWGGAKRVSLTVAGDTIELPLGPDGTFNDSPDLSGYKDGSLDIQCLAESKDNQMEKDAAVRKLAPILSLNAQKAQMVITVAGNAQPGQKVRVFARNAQGFDLDQMGVDFAGQHLEGQASPFELTAPMSDGAAVLTLNRRGFETGTATLIVASDKTPIYALAAVGIIVIGIVAYALLSKRKR